LEGWANRKAKEEISEIFVGNYTRCAIKIVASKYSREKYAVDNQKSRILKAIQLGCENVYAIGRDR
jgi:hypothetical protein